MSASATSRKTKEANSGTLAGLRNPDLIESLRVLSRQYDPQQGPIDASKKQDPRPPVRETGGNTLDSWLAPLVLTATTEHVEPSLAEPTY